MSSQRPSLDNPSLAVLLDNENEDLTNHGYSYYVSLLAIRKMWGPLTVAVLTKQFGRPPTNDEFVAEVHGTLVHAGFSLLERASLPQSPTISSPMNISLSWPS